MTPVYFARFQVGRIDATPVGPTFAYDSRWLATAGAFPMSLSIPLRDGTFGPDVLVPWLMNLLPEDPALRTVGRNLGVSPQDVLGLLDHMGRDVAGALSLGEPRPHETEFRIIDGAANLERIINDLPRKPFLAGDDGVSMSLAGAQDKLPVAKTPDGLAIPLNGTPSTHILKPDTERLPGSVQNEALCLTLARLCGLDAASVTTGRAGARSYLLVDRFDRKTDDNGTVRLHQEDFCQALSKPPAAKYESNQSGLAGPSLADMFRLVDRHMTAADAVALLDAVIFNILVCNTDAHAKNHALLLSHGSPRLAPLYDVMCAAAWDGITANLSQAVGGKNRGDHIHGRHWKRQAAACGLNETRVVARVAELVGKVDKALPESVATVEAMPAGGHVLLPRFRDAIAVRCARVSRNLDD